MKILFIVDSLVLGGGAERFAVNLGNELHDKGHEVHYLTFIDKNPKYEFKGKYYTLNQKKDKKINIKSILGFIKAGFKIKRICSDELIDTVIPVAELANYHAVLSSILGNKSKVIVTHHSNPEVYSSPEKRVMKIVYPKSDKVVCVSKSMENAFKKKIGVKNNISTIYNMLDIKNSIKLAEKELAEEYQEIFNSGFIFINIGRLDTSKGQWFLIRSFKKVVQKHGNAKLCILGDSSLSDLKKSDLENLVKELNLENNVTFLGNQSNVFSFLKNSNCFVLSSLFEGLPMTLIETLPMNIPIISTDCKTGPREILCPELELDEKIEYPFFGEYGILTMPFESRYVFENIEAEPLSEAEEMFADLMIKIIEEDELRKKYSNGLERAWNFDKTEVMKEWGRIIQ